ncbi:DUF2797 domain-containing protein [Streptomyces sp. RPT161]|uniref:DUF2797 domain-containing protein n=1 Tax=Streptomyces sp. RPT161 TaxID=3015993 RepID=UPI0022B8CE08|nr:DUF2797 domain-containing protein [Streptomyces sp. RPT161]
MSEWRCTGMSWRATGPVLGWSSATAGERERPLVLGESLAFAAGGDRRCGGVRRAGRRLRCPWQATVPDGAVSGQCPDCSAMDRSSSVAADTAFDDRRPFRLYLAWFGPGLLKLGITAAERGHNRLREQGALAHTWLGQGPLAAARRAEASLGPALGIPDRVRHATKLAARMAASDPADRTREMATAHECAVSCAAWPETLHSLPLEITDHTPAYGLDLASPPLPHAEISHLSAGSTVAGALTSLVGTDAYLSTGSGLFTLDLRLLSGWPLTSASPTDRTTAPNRPLGPREGDQDALF